MACDCENKRKLSDYDKMAELAKKAAMLERAVYVVYRKRDGTFAFDKEGTEIDGQIIEYKHYL